MQASRKRAPAKKTSGGARKQPRAIETRQRLIDAARGVFALEGFENTTLEDIAEAAGKTRGAFYANFSDKEDVFFAIFEEDIARDRELISLHLSEQAPLQERVKALARVLNEIVNDRSRMQLVLEFKQYAMRHIAKRGRPARLHDEMCKRCAEADLSKWLPQLGSDPEQRRSQFAQIRAIVDGIAINRMFDPGSLTDTQSVRVIEAVLAIAFESPEVNVP